MIQVNGLTKDYGARRAIDNLTFDAEQGEIVGFLGPNGAGKTTTMRILTGYMPPTDGTAMVAGYDVVEESLEVRKRVGDDYVVGVRFLADEVITGGSRIEDAAFYAVEFARAGFDFLSLSKGGKFEDAQQPKVGQAVYPYTGQSGYECMPTVLSDERGPFGRTVPLVEIIKQQVNNAGFRTPVVATGGIGTFEQAESILRNKQADIVGMARQALADPDWFIKVKLGRGDEVRRCTYTNYCEALDQAHRPVTCKLWDRVDLKEEGIALIDDGRRRLEPPSWNSLRR